MRAHSNTSTSVARGKTIAHTTTGRTNTLTVAVMTIHLQMNMLKEHRRRGLAKRDHGKDVLALDLTVGRPSSDEVIKAAASEVRTHAIAPASLSSSFEIGWREVIIPLGCS